jgi:hypothetical protein
MSEPRASELEQGGFRWEAAPRWPHAAPTAAGGVMLADGPLAVLHREGACCLLREPTPLGPVGWAIYKVWCGDMPGARAEWCLVFEAPTAVRRVYDFPPNWHTLPADALLALSWRR